MTESLRVLHLVDPGSPGSGACELRLAAATVARARPPRQDVMLLGNADHAALARRCGLAAVGSMCPPRLPHSAGRRALARWINRTEAANGSYDVIHAWSPRAAILATLAAPHRPRVACFTLGPVSAFQTHFLLTLMRHHPLTLRFASQGVLDEYCALGVRTSAAALLTPGVDPAEADPPASPDRASVRARWRDSAGVDPSRFVVGVLAEPIAWSDAMSAITAALRLRLSDRPVSILLHPSVHRRAQAERFARDFNAPEVMFTDHALAEPWRVLNGVDAVLHVGSDRNTTQLARLGSPFAALVGGGCALRPMPGILPLAWAMAARKPCVAEDGPAARALIEDDCSGLLVPQHDVNAMTDHLARIIDDRAFAASLGEHAHRRIARHMPIEAWADGLAEAWRQAVQRVDAAARAPLHHPVAGVRTALGS